MNPARQRTEQEGIGSAIPLGGSARPFLRASFSRIWVLSRSRPLRLTSAAKFVREDSVNDDFPTNIIVVGILFDKIAPAGLCVALLHRGNVVKGSPKINKPPTPSCASECETLDYPPYMFSLGRLPERCRNTSDTWTLCERSKPELPRQRACDAQKSCHRRSQTKVDREEPAIALGARLPP